MSEKNECLHAAMTGFFIGLLDLADSTTQLTRDDLMTKIEEAIALYGWKEEKNEKAN